MAELPAHQLIGVISDTHGQLRPEATAKLDGVHLIIHAGDVGRPEILAALRELAPVVAVRGNVDYGTWASELHYSEVVETAAGLIYVRHILDDIDLDPGAANIRVVITGHTHRPLIHERHGVLYLNPGSAGPRRFSLPISMACLEINGAEISHRLIDLEK